ncbi:hypothetical protein LWI29_012045 [Acer saccharum]|uniref:Uncharacterized protein n=1 Tax=Acer saccharum TaxID=4024 RepID=A0AA39RUI8_ACESA|nr:hypothetical protein LWI29_012045 [Acer saccharum]
MMQAMELGDKCTADKIESLIRNFHPDSPVPISVYVPSSEDDFIPNISPLSSSDSDSPVMPRSSKPGGSKRRASRVPQVNVVGEDELRKYRSRFEIPDSVTLMLPGNRAAWNPPENAVAIYGAMLSCGVTLPLQPFITRFLVEAQIAPAQLAPNSYRILMCLGLMWKLKGYEPPTPHEIHHFYTLRQAGNSGTYFLLSSPVENWIPKGVANPGQFFVGGKWGRDVFARGRLNLAAKKVSRHFTSPDAWWKAILVLLDEEISRLAAAVVLPLDERGRPFLLDEDKMIAQRLFSRLPARLPRLCDFDAVYDLQARAVKNSEAASKRHAAGLSKEGIASPDGGDPSDGEEAGDISEGGVESGQLAVHTEAAANTPAMATPSRKGKEKVSVSERERERERERGGGVSDIPIFDADVPETPLNPASDLAPRASRGKRLVEGTPDHAARPPKRASSVVQYVVSSDEEGADEPILAETPSAQTATHEGPVEGANVAVPSSEEDNELHVPASTPPQTAFPSRVASSPVAMGESNVSSGVPHVAPPVGSNEADRGTVSLSDFLAIEICSHLINNDVYIGEGWEHVKGCFSFQMMSELAENYKYENKVSREIKHLREQASVLATEKLSAEESYAQHLAHLRESADGHLSAQIATEEKLSATEEEVRLLKEQLSASQESLAAHLEAGRLAEEAKEKAEREALDLCNQLSSRELIFDNLKAVLEAEAVDRFKRSPAYNALLLSEFERGMRQSKKFFVMKDHSNEKALRRFDRSLQQHIASGVGSIKEQIKQWKAQCHYNRTEPHPMHLEIPSKRAFNTYYSGQKGSFSGSGAEPDLGPVAGRDYEPFMPDGDEEITWPSEEEIEDEEDSEGPPAAS